MDRAAYEIRRKQWWQIISDCSKSGMPKTEWCRQNGVSMRSMYYWQRKFRNEMIVLQGSETLPAVPVTELAEKPTHSDETVFVDLTNKLASSRCPPITVPKAFLTHS